MLTGLPRVAARNDDDVGPVAPHRLVSEPAPRERPRGEALDDDVRLRDEPQREVGGARIAQVQGRAALAVVVEREHARAVRRGLALERRICGAERVEGLSRFEVNDLGAVVGEVLPTNGPAAAQPSSTTRSPASAPAAAAGAASVAVALTPEASDARSIVVARERCSA